MVALTELSRSSKKKTNRLKHVLVLFRNTFTKISYFFFSLYMSVVFSDALLSLQAILEKTVGLYILYKILM